jgi:CRISPR-associated protein Csx17
MTIYEHVLHGCAPVPLAGYLKALGVFRLVAEQADTEAKGFWRDERFVLRTRLTEDNLVRFFVDDYRPTPIVAPWNGGSGFWPKDNRDGFDVIQNSSDLRLSWYRAAILTCQDLIRELELLEAPKEDRKADFVALLRSMLSDEACRWLDGALALTADGPRYPPILGTGGNDGRLDFSNNFMRRLIQVIANKNEESLEWLRASLFCTPCARLEKGAVGQFSPGAAGGVNAGVGFEEHSYVNPWDFIWTIEGALVFASAAVRRNAQDRTAALAFPFTTRMVGAGSGATALTDEADSRAEFWAALWTRAIGLDEMLLLFSEGRVVLGDVAARDGLDFARAAAQLGVARGIRAFQRHGFLMRAGKAYFATPLSRVRVQENPQVSLVSELDAGGWLQRARGAVRDENAPSSLGTIGRKLDESLFRLAYDNSSEAVQEVLIAVGVLMLEAARRPKLRKSDKGSPPLPPPPRLSKEWASAAYDPSHEFALAAAISSLDATAEDFRLPFRRHLAPIEWFKGREIWSEKTESQALAVWTGRDLVRDMVSVLERRLIEAQRRNFVNRDKQAELPLRSWRAAPLAAVAAFLDGHTDNDRIAGLAAGLAWARSRAEPFSGNAREDVLPFAYAALKPLFFPEGIQRENGEKRLSDPLPLVRLIRAGRIADAIKLAQRLARGAGLPTPFAQVDLASLPDPNRLVAALLFPIAPMAHDRLVARAYPDIAKDKEETHAA